MIKVAIIDDDPLARERVVATLRHCGYETASAPDGTSGIDLVRDHIPDLVLCDVNMPDLEGYDVLENLRADARTAAIPLVFMTARAERDDMRRGMERGADDYLTKPFTNDELIAAVNTQLAKRRVIIDQYESAINLLRNNIVYALPHELRTPLASCLGHAELLRMDAGCYTADDVRDVAESIFASSQRLQHVLENYLVYAQIEILASGTGELERLRQQQTPHAGQVIEARAREIAGKWQRGGDLVVDIDDFPAPIGADELGKIVEELIDNAFKFSSPGSVVTLRVMRDNETLHVEVSDRGRGMSAEQIALVGAYIQFDRALFEQQGLGLGLAIARRLADLYQGHLTIHSEAGAGTTVRFRLGLRP